MEKVWDIKTHSNCCPVSIKDIFQAREYIISGDYRRREYEGIAVEELCKIDLIEKPSERDRLNPNNYHFKGWRVEILCCGFDRKKVIDFLIVEQDEEVKMVPSK